MKEKILAMIQKIKNDESLDENVHLVFEGILNSLEILQLISELEENYDIKIPVEEVLPDNFDKVESISKMVKKLKG